MRIGVVPSILLHAGIAAAAVVVFPHTIEDLATESIIVPIDIVEISDTTNLRAPRPDPEPTPEPTPVAEDTPEPEAPPLPEPEDDKTPNDDVDEAGEADETVEDETPEIEPEPEPEPVEPEPEPTPTPKPTKTPDQVKEPEPKPTLNKKFLDRALTSAQEKKQERVAEREEKRAADLKKVEDANKSERSAGDRMRDTATWNDLLRSKLNGCWRDPSDMANADRLRVTYKIIFKRDGTLQRPPERVKPANISSGDQQMLIFDINAARAIQKCAPYDDIFPPELYEEWREFTFNFGIASE